MTPRESSRRGPRRMTTWPGHARRLALIELHAGGKRTETRWILKPADSRGLSTDRRTRGSADDGGDASNGHHAPRWLDGTMVGGRLQLPAARSARGPPPCRGAGHHGSLDQARRVKCRSRAGRNRSPAWSPTHPGGPVRVSRLHLRLRSCRSPIPPCPALRVLHDPRAMSRKDLARWAVAQRGWGRCSIPATCAAANTVDECSHRRRPSSPTPSP